MLSAVSTYTFAITVAVNVPPTSVAAKTAVEPSLFNVILRPVVVQGTLSPTDKEEVLWTTYNRLLFHKESHFSLEYANKILSI